MASVVTIAAERDFDLTAAVCTYGYYRLEPNAWDEAAGVSGVFGQAVEQRGGAVGDRAHHAAGTRSAHVIYDRQAPYQFLVYWFELWHGYRETGVL